MPQAVFAACLVAVLAGCGSLGPVATAPDATAPDATTTGAPIVARGDIAESFAQTPPASAAAAELVAAAVAAATPEATVPAAEVAIAEPGDTDAVHVEPSTTLEPVGNLWDRIRAGFAMPPLDSALVAHHERALLSRPDYLERMIERGRPYLFHIVDEVKKRGLPTELALLPFIESAMNPGATSHAQAAGLWQFIPSTGRAYDLKQNWWVDNRRDVIQSTRAALDYLEKIYAFNDDDWFLALASYNWGEGAVARARKANRRRGKPDDYVNLRMPRETRHYVPKLIALKNVVMRAESLSLALPYLPDKAYFATVDKLRPMDLELAARFAGMTVDEFVKLNPAHNRPVISASRTHSIVLPADRIAGFVAAVREHEANERVFASWQPYTLQPGDTLGSVARKFGLTVAELRDANGLRSSSTLLAGSRILAPHKTVVDESRVERFSGARLVERVDTPARYYTPKRRESLARIGKRWGASVTQLRRWNGLGRKVTTVAGGTRIQVRPPSVVTVVTDERGRRQVVSSRLASASTGAEPAKDAAATDAEPGKRPAARARPTQPDARALRIGSPSKATRPSSKRRTPAM